MVPGISGRGAYSNYPFRNRYYNVKCNSTFIVLYRCSFIINRLDSKFLLKLLVSEMSLFHHIDPTVRADLTFREFRFLMKSDIG
jgi:hypothetical protein